MRWRWLHVSTAGRPQPSMSAVNFAKRSSVTFEDSGTGEAQTGRFTEHHAFLAQLHLYQIDARTLAIESITSRIDLALNRMSRCTMHSSPVQGSPLWLPTFSLGWVCPGSNESVGRVQSSETMAGNQYLKAALSIPAPAASHSKTSYLAVGYRRSSARHGPAKATVALEQSDLEFCLELEF